MSRLERPRRKWPIPFATVAYCLAVAAVAIWLVPFFNGPANSPYVYAMLILAPYLLYREYKFIFETNQRVDFLASEFVTEVAEDEDAYVPSSPRTSRSGYSEAVDDFTPAAGNSVEALEHMLRTAANEHHHQTRIEK